MNLDMPEATTEDYDGMRNKFIRDENAREVSPLSFILFLLVWFQGTTISARVQAALNDALDCNTEDLENVLSNGGRKNPFLNYFTPTSASAAATDASHGTSSGGGGMSASLGDNSESKREEERGRNVSTSSSTYKGPSSSKKK